MLDGYRALGWTPDDFSRRRDARAALASALDAAVARGGSGRSVLAALRALLPVTAAALGPASGARAVLATLGEVRVLAAGDRFEVEVRHGERWERTFGAATLDAAVEHAARTEVERRLRSGHARMPLPRGGALVWSAGAWRHEHTSPMGRTTRSGSWTTSYDLLRSPRSGGVRADADGYRASVAVEHTAALAALRERLPDPMPGTEDSKGDWTRDPHR